MKLVGISLFCILMMIDGCFCEDTSRQEFIKFMEASRREWYGAPKVTLTEAQLAYFYSLGEFKPDTNLPPIYPYSRTKRDTHTNPMKIRKEIRQLTTLERTNLFNAFNAMKRNTIDGMSEYDIFVALHRNAPSAHYGPGFLPWHREYLWRFELALQVHDSTVALPYWDSTLDQRIPEPKQSYLWSNTFLGNNEGPVRTGHFAYWNAAAILGCSGPLSRAAMSAPQAHNYLFDESKIQSVLRQNKYSDISTGIPFGQFELDHGGPHIFLGGQMGSITCSPSDPAFWMHHAFIDCIWESFRQNSQTTPKELEYPTSAEGNIGGSAHEPFSPMEPFAGLVNIHGLSNHYTNYYYQCAPRPHTCNSNSDCGSLYLWCDMTDCLCKAKIKLGGDCTGFSGGNPCYGHFVSCVNNVCRTNMIVKPWTGFVPLAPKETALAPAL